MCGQQPGGILQDGGELYDDRARREQTQEKAHTPTVQQGKDAYDSPRRMNVQETDMAEAKLNDFLREKCLWSTARILPLC